MLIYQQVQKFIKKSDNIIIPDKNTLIKEKGGTFLCMTDDNKQSEELFKIKLINDRISCGKRQLH